MAPALVTLLYVPVVLWVALGLGLIVAFRRSTAGVVLRLATAFLALWALFATTSLVWVLSNGGYGALLVLARTPFAIFEIGAWRLWAIGAVGAFGVFAVAFTLNQLAGQGLLAVLRPTPLRWPHRLPHPSGRTSLLRYDGPRPEAFSFALLAWGGRGRPWVHRHEVILVSDALLAALTPEEMEAVVAHELGHVRGLDARYLTFFRTLARMMVWDPVLGHIARALTRREEYLADDAAVALTRHPMALARALFKSLTFATPGPPRPGVSFVGPGDRPGRVETLRRIERLIAMAEHDNGPAP